MKKLLLFAVVLILFSFSAPDKDIGVLSRLVILEVTIEADMEEGLVHESVGKAYLHNIRMCREILEEQQAKN